MFDFRFYFALFLRRLPYFIIFTVAGAAVGLGLALTLPPTYEAQARLVVESEQIPGELAETTVRTESTEQLQIIEQRIKARDTLLDMALRLDIYEDGTVRNPDEALRPDQIVEDLRERIVINTTGGNSRGQVNATLVDVRFSASDARLAAEVTNEVVTLIQQENVRMRTGTSSETLEFFEQEVTRLDEELAIRGAEIIQFQEANKEALPESLDFRRNQQNAAQERLLALQRDEEIITNRRDSLVELFEQTGTVGLENGGGQLSDTERELRRLEAEYRRSVAVLSLDNPRVRALVRQIEGLKELVAQENAEGSTIVDSDTPAAPPSAYQIQLTDFENQLDFIREQRAQLEEELAALQETIEATPANAVALDTLQRDYEATRLQYDAAVSARAQAKTGDIIEALNKGERISIIEQAVAPEDPTSPNRPKLAMAGTAAGMLVAFGVVVLLELLNTAIRRPQDIIQQLEITPFATLPYIRTQQDIRRRRVLILGAVIGVGGGVFGALWALDTYVIPLDLLLQRILDQLPSYDLELQTGGGSS